jgi:hypothetical protein
LTVRKQQSVCKPKFGTILNEQAGAGIERQLAHGERNNLRAAYNFAEYLPERRRMMQAWANYLDVLTGIT